MKQITWLTGLLLPGLFIAMLLTACENDLNQVKKISALASSKPIDSTKGVDVVYSDSAKVRAHVLSPLMLTHTVSQTNSYHEMPQGVKIVFYDDKLNQNVKGYDPEKHIISTAVSDYAITSNFDKLIELRKNVVITNKDGDVFTTQQLFYDVTKKKIYTNQYCHMTKIDGTVLDGTSFISNETFTEYKFTQGKGQIATKGNLTE